MNESGEIPKVKQDLLRYSRAVEMLIKVIQVPFKSPPGFEGIKGFNPNGIDLENLKEFPRFKQICWAAFDILADVSPFQLQPKGTSSEGKEVTDFCCCSCLIL